MPSRAISFTAWLCALLCLALPLTAQTAPDSNHHRAGSGALEIPENCKTSDKISESGQALLQAAVSRPNVQSYNALGTFYGRTGNASCAVAAFEAALAFDPHERQTRYELALA